MHEERGDVITAYLLRLVGGLALAGLLVIETAALTVNRIGLEEVVQRAADQAVAAYIEHRSSAAAEDAARQRLRRADAELLKVTVEADAVTVRATRSATVVLSDRIDALSHLVAPTTTARASVGH